MREKVAVALSGGIDSSVAAALLIREGYEVFGVTMNLGSFMSDEEAKRAAKVLGIPHFTVDLIETFQQEIIDYFCEEYFKGRTPNPCIRCNKVIKFGKFLDFVRELGANYLATGHYVKVSYSEKEKQYLVLKAEDKQKDQSYMLWSLSQEQLKFLKMPLGFLKKAEVRNLARESGLSFGKEESQEICFVKGGNYPQFLKEYFKKPILSGKITDKENNILGEHKGLPFYTIGQRKGLGIAHPTPLYVIDIIADENRIVVGVEEDLNKKSLIACEVNFILSKLSSRVIEVEAQIRYNALPGPARITILDDERALVEFVQPQRAITRSQSVVFYQKDLLLGGGIIESLN